MLYTPLWKRILVWAIVVFGLAMAMPNLFYGRVQDHNDALKAIAKTHTAPTPAQQAKINEWPAWLPSSLVNLGLDLRGGAHLLAEVQLSDVYKQHMNSLWPEVRDALRKVRAQVGSIRRQPSASDVLRIAISNPAGMDAAIAAVKKLARPVSSLTGVGQTDIVVTADNGMVNIALSNPEKVQLDQLAMSQSLEVIRRRVDQAGTREPSIQRQGSDRILIEVPGVGSAEDLKAIIGTTAKLTFNEVVSSTGDKNANPGPGNELLPSADQPGLYYIVKSIPVVTGYDLTNAQPSFDQNNQPAVSFQFDVSGARKFGDYTATHIGQPFAIVLDNKVISAPVIQAHIGGGSGIITGNFTVQSSTNLAVLLRSGALPASMKFLEERTIGPELGADSVKAGEVAAVVALIAVGLFMFASYGFFGFVADVALAIEITLVFAVLSIIGGTLTLPGIAGIVLTIGMAVDANVLVYERIREEIRLATNPARAIELGYERAFSAILDANVTTLVTAAVLYYFGAGPVKGFAITLGIGIVTSVFVAMYVTRGMIEFWFNRRKPKTIIV